MFFSVCNLYCLDVSNLWNGFCDVFSSIEHRFHVTNNQVGRTNVKHNSWVPLLPWTTEINNIMITNLENLVGSRGSPQQFSSLEDVRTYLQDLSNHEYAITFDYISCIHSTVLNSELRGFFIEVGRRILLQYSLGNPSLTECDIFTEAESHKALKEVRFWDQTQLSEVFYRAVLWWDILMNSSKHNTCPSYFQKTYNKYYSASGFDNFALYYTFFVCCAFSLKIACDLHVLDFDIWVYWMNHYCESIGMAFDVEEFKRYERLVAFKENILSTMRITTAAHYINLYYVCVGWDLDIEITPRMTEIEKMKKTEQLGKCKHVIILTWALLYLCNWSYEFISDSQKKLAYGILLFVITVGTSDKVVPEKERHTYLVILENLFQISRLEEDAQKVLEHITIVYRDHYETIKQVCQNYIDLYNKHSLVLF